ncbi:MAG TPA: efflux RND transporter periplasmic adaptor subunit [Pirellulales bacterium]
MPRMIASLALVCGLLGPGVWAAVGQDRGTPEPTKVSVAVPLLHEIDADATADGRIVASQSAALRSRVFGVVTKVHFPYGGEVKEGDVILELDARPYEASARIKEAGVMRTRAALERARMNLENAQKLVANNAASNAERDLSRTSLDEAQAAAAEAEGALALARLDLESCRIVAPFSGKLSRSKVTQGEQVAPQSEPFATLAVVDPLAVEWSVAPAVMNSLVARSPVRDSASDGGPQDLIGLPFAVRPLRGDAESIQAKVVHIGETTSPSGRERSQTVTALLPNPDRKLFVGLGVEVLMPLGRQKVQLLPARAFTAVGGNARFPDRGTFGGRGFEAPAPDAAGTTLRRGERVAVMSLLDDGRVASSTAVLLQPVGDLWAFRAELPPNSKVILDPETAQSRERVGTGLEGVEEKIAPPK